MPSTVVYLDDQLHLVGLAYRTVEAYVDAIIADGTLAEGLSQEGDSFVDVYQHELF